MEFHEKLQMLRKSRGLTQEELAEDLYVSRTAISKWESGRGYPGIDSLKEISRYFSVSIDELLSGEKMLSIAEKENRDNLQNICSLMIGILDVFSLVLIILPLYPNPVNGFVYSVNLFEYTKTTSLNHVMYWIIYIALFTLGITKLLLTGLVIKKYNKFLTLISMLLSIIGVLFLAMNRESYAVIVVFVLLITKCIILFKNNNCKNIML